MKKSSRAGQAFRPGGRIGRITAGVDPHLVAGTLLGALAQRLLRKSASMLAFALLAELIRTLPYRLLLAEGDANTTESF